MSIFPGTDLGATGLDSLLVEDGIICDVGYRKYPILIPAAGYAEQSPADWWRALRESPAEAMTISCVRPDEIAGIGLSSQMHGMVLTDADDRLLYPAVIWCDQRSANEVAMIRERAGMESLGQWTQNPADVGFQLCHCCGCAKTGPKSMIKSITYCFRRIIFVSC